MSGLARTHQMSLMSYKKPLFKITSVGAMYMIGILTNVGQLEGTGISPERNEKKLKISCTGTIPSLLNDFSKIDRTTRAPKMDGCPDLKQSDKESD